MVVRFHLAGPNNMTLHVEPHYAKGRRGKPRLKTGRFRTHLATPRNKSDYEKILREEYPSTSSSAPSGGTRQQRGKREEGGMSLPWSRHVYNDRRFIGPRAHRHFTK